MWAFAQSALALICFLTYDFLLEDLFGKDVSYLQWLGIIIISACVIPGSRPTDTTNTEKRLTDFTESRIKKRHAR